MTQQPTPPAAGRRPERNNELSSSPPLLPTKLYAVPIRSGLVARSRLIQRLSAAQAGVQKLTLVSAPAGFGKTTLVNHWLTTAATDASPQVAWYSLDDSDNDPNRFLRYLIAALQRVHDVVGQSLLGLTQTPPIEAQVAILVNDLAAVSEPFVLVLDDYHLIQHEKIHRLIEELLEHQPPQMHLVLTTREDPPLPLSRMRVRGHIEEIRQRDLRFTAQEAANFLNQTMGLNLDSGAVAALEKRTEGWIAGLQLAGLSLQGRDQPSVTDFIAAFSGSNRYVIDYLVEEVIYQQPKNIRRFLQRTAILERFCAPLCDVVADQLDSQMILSYLEQVNLFLIPLDEQRRWYRYHHLFAEFLQTELEPAQQQALYRKAAHWFEKNKLLPEAIKYALAANDFEWVEQLISRSADDALSHSQFYTLQQWLTALPVSVIEQNGELAIYRGWVEWMLGDADLAAYYATLAEAGLPDNTSPMQRGKLISLQACLAISQQENGIEIAQKAVSLLPETTPFYSGMALLVLSEAQNFVGDSRGAEDTLNRALQLGHKHNDPLMTVGAIVNLAQIINWQGRRHEAEAMCRQILAERWGVDDHGNLTHIGSVAYATLAEIVYYSGNLEQAEAYLKTATDVIPRESTFITFQVSVNLTQALIYAGQGRFEEAVSASQQVRRAIELGNFTTYESVIAALEAHYLLRAGRLDEVESWAKDVKMPTGERLSLMREFELQTYARLLHIKQQTEAALALLEQVDRSSQDNERLLMQLTTRLLRVHILAAAGQTQQAHDLLAKTVQQAAPEAYRQMFINEGLPLLTLLPAVRHIAPTFIDEVLALAEPRFGPLAADAAPSQPAAASAPAPPPAYASTDAELLIEPLTDRELEVLALVAVGYSNKDAAKKLVVTVGTVKKHLSNIFGKLAVNSRTQAVAKARELHLLPPE